MGEAVGLLTSLGLVTPGTAEPTGMGGELGGVQAWDKRGSPGKQRPRRAGRRRCLGAGRPPGLRRLLKKGLSCTQPMPCSSAPPSQEGRVVRQ